MIEDGTFYTGKLLRGLLFICTLQLSLVTSQLLALSEVKAILFSRRFACSDPGLGGVVVMLFRIWPKLFVC